MLQNVNHVKIYLLKKKIIQKFKDEKFFSLVHFVKEILKWYFDTVTVLFYVEFKFCHEIYVALMCCFEVFIESFLF